MGNKLTFFARLAVDTDYSGALKAVEKYITARKGDKTFYQKFKLRVDIKTPDMIVSHFTDSDTYLENPDIISSSYDKY